MKNYKGIILAGGSGSRLLPITKTVTKQLLPIYNKPMIYYPLSTLMDGGIKDILIISTPASIPLFRELLGDGSKFGIKISYKVQHNPNGIAEAFLLGEDFISEDNVALILGDNIFYGDKIGDILLETQKSNTGATIFSYHVTDPSRFGVVEFDNNQKVLSIEEKPCNPKSNYAITGLYFYNNDVVQLAKSLTPSSRGELEITDLNKIYLNNGALETKLLGHGYAWLDSGTFDSLHEASSFIQTIERRQGLKVGCIEEIAYRNGWINSSQINLIASELGENDYKDYLLSVLERKYY